MAECRLSRLQYRDRTPRIPPPPPPRPPHTTPLLSESEPGDSPALLPPLLLLVQISPLVCPLDSLGHCWVLMQAGRSSSHRLCGGGGGGGGGGSGVAGQEPGLHEEEAPEPEPALPSESLSDCGAGSLSPPPPVGCTMQADIMGLR